MARTDAYEEVTPETDYDSTLVESEVNEAEVEGTEGDTATEAVDTEATDPEADAKAAELEAKIEATVDAFKAAAIEAAGAADADGHLNPDQLSPVVTAYRAVEGGNKGKKLAKDFVQEQMKDALNTGTRESFTVAMSWNVIQDAIQTAPTKSSGGGGKSTATPVSQTQLYADKIASLRLALELAEANVPEGVDENWEDKVTGDLDKAQALLDFHSADQDEDAEEPEASPVERAAVKLASGRGPRKAGRPSGAPYQGTRRDVAAHITNAFANHPSGTFLSIAQIKATPSEEYGSDSPSAGAISARLFPKAGPDKMSVAGVVAAQEDGKNGARKI